MREAKRTLARSQMALARLRGKLPKDIPFDLKRCESCRRAKQGAIVCRVVRGHTGIEGADGDDWAPPAGFREWLAEWKAGDGKSTIRTPPKKPKRPRPPPKPKEDPEPDPERRQTATARQEAAAARAAAYEKIRADEIARTTKKPRPAPAARRAPAERKPVARKATPPPIGATARQQAAAAKVAAYAKIRADEIARGEAKKRAKEASPRAAPKRKAPPPRSASPSPPVEQYHEHQQRRAPPRKAKEPPPKVEPRPAARKAPRRPPAARLASPRAPARAPAPRARSPAPKPAVRRRRLWSSTDSDDDDPLLPRRTPEMRRRDRRAAPGAAWVRGDLDETEVDAFIEQARSLGVGEEKALEELNDRENDIQATLRSFGGGASQPPGDQALSSAVDAFLAAAALLGGMQKPDTVEKKKEARSLDNARRRAWSDHDLHRFAEALLDTDRDCAQALKRLQKAPRGGHRTESAASFSRCTVGDALDLYYGRFKGSPQYTAWKVRLDEQREAWKQREETIGRLPGARGFRLQAKPIDVDKPRKELNPQGLVDVEPIVATDSRRLGDASSRAGTRLQNEQSKLARSDRRAAHDAAQSAMEAQPRAPPRSFSLPASPFVGPFDAATEEARRLIAYSRYDPAAPLEFACLCGCGDRVDNRGRATSHRRKWATRSCRERASRDPRLRDVFEQLPPNSADFAAPASASPQRLHYEPREDDLCVCLCGCGKAIDNRGRLASHRRKWASAACRQRAHAERARDARLGRRMSVCAPDDVVSGASRRGSVDHQRAPRRVFVHAGVMVAKVFDGRVLAGDVRERAPPRRDAATGALVRAWRVVFTDPEGDDRALQLTAAAIAELILQGPAPDADARLEAELEKAELHDESLPAHRRFRGVTRKWYGDSARYNAAFSLLGDRFLLGGYDGPVQAARAWDQVAWRAGRGHDLNVVKFHGAPPSPSHDEQRALAQRLRDNVRVRNAPVDADAVAAAAPPPSPLVRTPQKLALDEANTPDSKRPRPSLAVDDELTPAAMASASRLDSKDDIFSSSDSDDESLAPPPADDFLARSPARLALDSDSDDEPVGDLSDGGQPPTPAARHDTPAAPSPVNRVITESPPAPAPSRLQDDDSSMVGDIAASPARPPVAQQPAMFAPPTLPAVSPPPVEAVPPKTQDEPMPSLN